ncbi:MAG: cyclase family protein [bacterium]|nr:cyclase family protein [bacterium]
MRTFGKKTVIVLGVFVASAIAQNNPVDEKWWPSEFGADDKVGAVNYITPQKRVAAAMLVKKGMTATLGMPYYNGMPLVPGRTFAMSIPGGGAPTHGPFNWPGANYDMTFMDELLTAEIGQVGTQWDGLAHPMIRVQGVEGWKDGNYFYNGHRLEDVGGPRGLNHVGTEHIAQAGFFTRGILIDVAVLKGVKRLEKGYAITMDDYKAALKAQGIEGVGQGDVVLFRTGWNSLWKDYENRTPEQMAADHAEFNSGDPGVSKEMVDYLAAQKVSMVGSDTWGFEPYEDMSRLDELESFAYGHMNLVVRRGITNFENLDLDVLSQEKAYEFLFVWAPLKLVGATGSPGNPTAAW